MITLKSPNEIEKMRKAGRVVAEVLDAMRENVAPGVTTGELDELAQRGLYILDDLRGTGVLAPRPLRGAHSMLTDAVGSIATVAASAERDPAAAAKTIGFYVEWVQPALERIENFTWRLRPMPSPGDVPHVPGLNS